MKKNVPFVITIAGSDPSGGAGIEADIKTLTSLKVYALDVITTQTIQNTKGVYEKIFLSPEIIKKQLEKIFEDFKVDVVKLGMPGNKEIINVILPFIAGKTIIFDPVIYSKNGFPLTDESEVDYIKEKILPISTIITPNYFELKSFSGLETESPAKMAKKLLLDFKGISAIVVKGGHIDEEKETIIDILVLREKEDFKVFKFRHKRIRTKNLHGTGCTLSSAIAAYIARENSVELSVKKGIKYLTKIIKKSASYAIGMGNGPLIHFLGK
ncbi:MAG: bifunctional hydroxymethylpyrimidine kinase/phosphomethylpyrimidine kinase [Brevinematia bacterium]